MRNEVRQKFIIGFGPSDTWRSDGFASWYITVIFQEVYPVHLAEFVMEEKLGAVHVRSMPINHTTRALRTGKIEPLI